MMYGMCKTINANPRTLVAERCWNPYTTRATVWRAIESGSLDLTLHDRLPRSWWWPVSFSSLNHDRECSSGPVALSLPATACISAHYRTDPHQGCNAAGERIFDRWRWRYWHLAPHAKVRTHPNVLYVPLCARIALNAREESSLFFKPKSWRLCTTDLDEC